MKTKTKTYTVYKFNELSQESQEKALEMNFDINISGNWADFLYEEADSIGLRLIPGPTIEGELMKEASEVITLIKSHYEKESGPYKTAIKYEKLFNNAGKLSRGARLKRAFKNDLISDYANILQEKFDYLTSKEMVIKRIKTSDYDFTEDGEID